MFKIGTYLPKKIVSNDDLEYLGWSSGKIYKKTGIKTRHICETSETALDLAEQACLNVFEEYDINKNDIDYVILCTQSPDYVIPNNISLLHHRLDLNNNIGTLEFNHGCSGYIYGLSIAKALLNTSLATNVLLVTADSYSKYIDIDDRANKTIFGDGATATIITNEESSKFGEFIFGTDGSGSVNLCVNNSGLSEKKLTNDGFENKLFMNGGEIFNFALEKVPESIAGILDKHHYSLDDIDHFLFHQANNFMLEHLKTKIGIPDHKFHKFIEDIGNTVSSTIPFLINDLNQKSILKSGDKILLIGFGVGYSWGITIIEY